MKRGGRLNPGKGFAPRAAGLSRRGALQRGAETSRKAALKSKHKPATPEEKCTRELVKARSNGACEGCDSARAAHMAHRVAEGQGGPWCPSNIVHLCAACHLGWAHLNPTAAEVVGWILPSTVDPKTVPVRFAHGRTVFLEPDGSITPTQRNAARWLSTASTDA